MTPGRKTSEFWVALAPWVLQIVGIILFAFDLITEDILKIVIGIGTPSGGVASIGYSLSRARVKTNGG